MSRIGVKPIPLPAGVQASVEGPVVRVRGPKGELTFTAPAGITVRVDGGQVRVERAGGDEAHLRALHGTSRSLIANMVKGVATGYEKQLEIQGVGFKATQQGRKLIFNLGYSHPIEFEPPAGVNVTVKDGVLLTVSGPDKQAVGEVSARIRAFYKAEPYKGKGVRYVGEHVRRKAGKTVA